MFVYQPTFSTLAFKEDKGSEYVIAWKSKGLFKTEFYLLHNAFLPKVKCFEHKTGIQFNNTPLVIDRKICNQNCKCLCCL